MKTWIPPKNMTKRSLLLDVNSIYDPIDLITPVLIKEKIFIQQLWVTKMSWDDVLPNELQSRWINFYSNMACLHQLFIPRAVLSPAMHWELYGFCDASQHAFGACVYIRSSTSDGHAEVHLYTSRSRVTPLKANNHPASRIERCSVVGGVTFRSYQGTPSTRYCSAFS